MKCPVCGAWSEVKETREYGNIQTKRRRKCGNGHLFTTLEVLPALVRGGAELSKTVRRVQAARELWERDRTIAKAVLAGVPSKELADKYRISQCRVRAVWRMHAASLNPATTPIPTVSPNQGATRDE